MADRFCGFPNGTNVSDSARQDLYFMHDANGTAVVELSDCARVERPRVLKVKKIVHVLAHRRPTQWIFNVCVLFPRRDR